MNERVRGETAVQSAEADARGAEEVMSGVSRAAAPRASGGIGAAAAPRPGGIAAVWGVAREAVASWISHRPSSLGAALAYYTAFSMAPLLLNVTVALAAVVPIWL